MAVAVAAEGEAPVEAADEGPAVGLNALGEDERRGCKLRAQADGMEGRERPPGATNEGARDVGEDSSKGRGTGGDVQKASGMEGNDG